MRVALDFYRILMVPLSVDAGALESAYRERVHQELWRGFSDQAIASRRLLLDEAHGVLGDPAQRQEYDTHLKAVNPSLDLLPQQVSGALIVLSEIGDYEGAIAGAEAALAFDATQSDYILVRAIARLAMGRDRWQDRDYEGAATLLHRANDELMQHHCFPEMQADIRSDLNQLRPYRILELLAHSSLDAPERREGLRLLRALLDERMGIEGKGPDGSGLTMEDALRFIQKARSHMTLNEQHELFEIEADRPSLVAAYLAAYALMARGYVERRPLLMRRARGRLVKLVQRHDVYLEQAICTLLLGQTDEALRLMRLSHDAKAARTIKELSGDREDWLLGLCRYVERWFRREVFPEYRDLDASGVSLNVYFEDPQVQAYLEAMPTSAEVAEQFDRQSRAQTTLAPAARSEGAGAQSAETAVAIELGAVAQHSAIAATAVATPVGSNGAIAGNGTLADVERSASPVVDREATNGTTHGDDLYGTHARSTNGRDRRSYGLEDLGPSAGGDSWLSDSGATSWKPAPVGDFLPDYDDPAPEDVALALEPANQTSAHPRVLPSWLWKVGGVFLATALCLVAVRWYGSSSEPAIVDIDTTAEIDTPAGGLDGVINNEAIAPDSVAAPSGGPSGVSQSEANQSEVDRLVNAAEFLNPDEAAIGPQAAVVENADEAALPGGSADVTALLSANGPLSEDGARAAIDAWQAAKHAAMSSDYQSEALADILTDPMLTNWQARSRSYQQQGARMDYTLRELQVQEVIPQGDDRASVVVEIDEARDYWVNDTQIAQYSSASVYRVRYDLVRRDDGRWAISKYVLL